MKSNFQLCSLLWIQVFIKQKKKKLIVPRLVLELTVRVRPIYGIYLVKNYKDALHPGAGGGGGLP